MVFVLDKHKKPLMPCHPARAREFLKSGRARVHRRTPFTIRLIDRTLSGSVVQPVRLKIDPGSKTTGMALVRVEVTEDGPVHHALHLSELEHRGGTIKKKLDQRRAFRRRRRSELRYRKPRFDNRRRPEGWLPPSLRHRVDSVIAWVDRYRALAPISGISQELVRFDLQKMENPEISSIEYQQGTLFGYEVREYLLEKWGRRCAYCNVEKVPLEIEHIVPKSIGGTNRISNLTLACRPCNKRKDDRNIREFLKKKPDLLRRILKIAKVPLKDATAVNTTRWALFGRLKETGLPAETSSGGRTKWNRTRFGLPKAHCLDALCVGNASFATTRNNHVLAIKATGRGSHQRTRLDSFGFPRGYLPRTKDHCGFRTGDLVRAEVPSGKKSGSHRGRVAVRASGSFNIQTGAGVVQGIPHRHCRLVQRADGYGYHQSNLHQKGESAFLPGMNDGVSCAN